MARSRGSLEVTSAYLGNQVGSPSELRTAEKGGRKAKLEGFREAIEKTSCRPRERRPGVLENPYSPIAGLLLAHAELKIPEMLVNC